MRDINIPVPNPALSAILKSDEVRSLVREKAEIAQAIYRGLVAKRSGRLARSARVQTFEDDGRWKGRLIVDAPYAASHEYGTGRTGGRPIQRAAHDLNRVLNAMAQL